MVRFGGFRRVAEQLHLHWQGRGGCLAFPATMSAASPAAYSGRAAAPLAARGQLNTSGSSSGATIDSSDDGSFLRPARDASSFHRQQGVVASSNLSSRNTGSNAAVPSRRQAVALRRAPAAARVAAPSTANTAPPEAQAEQSSLAALPEATAQASPALLAAAVEVRAFMRERQLDHVPGRAGLEAAGALAPRRASPGRNRCRTDSNTGGVQVTTIAMTSGLNPIPIPC